MTHNNIFQEIEEDLERQKLEALWKNYGPFVMFGAAVIVLATAGFTAWHGWRGGQEQKATAGLIEILDAPGSDPTKEIAALETFADKNKSETQAVFAQFHAAALTEASGDTKKAAALYDAIADDHGVDSAFRQLADLMSVEVQMDSGDPVLLQKRLQPLLADNAPWRFTAMEYAGFLALRAGDKAKAKQLFTELSQDASVPASLSARASDMARFLGE
jgi:hypothetical protein